MIQKTKKNQFPRIPSHEYIHHCEQFELKFGMRGEECLLTNFFKFHEDRTTSTTFLQCCRKTYWTDLLTL